MLKAILEGKAGRITDLSGPGEQCWRDVFRKREDLLTAVFFSRIRYLSHEGEQKVLGLLLGEALALSLGSIQEIVFWPWLKGLEGRKHVEPDVLILFADSLLLIEVKPPFGGEQNEDQWFAQVKSLVLQRGLESAEFSVPDAFHFLALGRNTPDAQRSAENLEASFSTHGLSGVHRHEWSDICLGIRKLADEENGRDRIVFSDWLSAFELFGLIERPLPFDHMVDLTIPNVQGWRVTMQKYETPETRNKLNSVDWSALGESTNKIKLEVQLWK
jgi:hypothetical protein